LPWSLMCRTGSQSGLIGFLLRAIRASLGVRPPFLRLHGAQAHTMFSHVVLPPRLRGRTWSRVASLGVSSFEQYWQVKLSRARRLARERGGDLRPARKYRSRRTTAGARIANVTERISWSYSSTTSTFPRNQRLTAFCQEMMRIGSKLALRRRTVFMLQLVDTWLPQQLQHFFHH
jgi:hypothetical protein